MGLPPQKKKNNKMGVPGEEKEGNSQNPNFCKRNLQNHREFKMKS